MGTRNLTIVVKDGKHVVAQYCQWDGYPSGTGLVVLDFCRRLAGSKVRAQFERGLWQCRFISPEEYEALWKPHRNPQSGALEGFVTMDEANSFKKANPQLDRDMGPDVLPFILEHDPSKGEIPLRDSYSFAADSLFCEWAYVVDLDKGTFEVFKGFNKQPVPAGERFASLAQVHHNTGDYCPVRHLRTFKLDALPSDGVFLEECEPGEEE